MKFEYFEIRPCIETFTRLADQTEEGSIDSFRSEENYQAALSTIDASGTSYKTFWTLYGIDPEGLGFAIGDFTTKADAHQIMNAILAPMAEARDLIDDNAETDDGKGGVVTGPERASVILTDFINQCSNAERI